MDAAWAHIAMPGAVWTGAQRVAIAFEARAATKCRLCAERKAAVSPYHLEGDHYSANSLSRHKQQIECETGGGPQFP